MEKKELCQSTENMGNKAEGVWGVVVSFYPEQRSN